jgi:hypothetical protein
MTSKKWIFLFVIFSSLMFIMIGLINYSFDPYYSFLNSNSFNQKIIMKDERLVKSNDFLRHGRSFDGVLFGSSVSTYLNTSKIKNEKVFNFSVSSFQPKELEKYFEFVLKVNPNIKKVYLSLDFNEYFLNSYHTKDPDYYLSKIQSPFFIFKSLLSIDVLKDSIQTFRNINKHLNKRYYNRNRQGLIDPIDLERARKDIDLGLEKNNMKGVKVDPNYLGYFSFLKRHQDIQIVVLTAPVSAKRIRLYQDKFPQEYREWLKELKNSFGSIFHFCFINEFTQNMDEYFYDSYHFYPTMGDEIIDFINNQKSSIGLIY